MVNTPLQPLSMTALLLQQSPRSPNALYLNSLSSCQQRSQYDNELRQVTSEKYYVEA